MADPQRPSPSDPLDTWRTLVEGSLAGRDFSTLRAHTHDGVPLEPLYAARRDVAPIGGRAEAHWTIVQVLDHPDPEQANEQALDDLKGGADGLSLRFAGSPLGGDFGLPIAPDTTPRVLEGIDLAAVALRIEPHRESAAAARGLKQFVAQRGLAPELASVAFGFDPISVRALEGAVGEPDGGTLAALAFELRDARFRGPFVELDARPYHEAGASMAQQLGIILASAVWWLRAFDKAGASFADAILLCGASLSVDRDEFASVAGLRALRLMWARLLEVCDLPQTAIRVHAETSRRMIVRADPHSNLLRATIAGIAAAIGGADSIAVLPHTAALGLPDRNARALARNIQQLILHETDVPDVADAAAGSGAIEALTDSLAERGWAEFQQIEREGGVAASLAAGALQKRIASARDALAQTVATETAPLVGATVHRPSGATVEPPENDRAIQPEGRLAPVRLEEIAAAAS
jgi:methylmalonyl-CoA mutase